MAKGNAVIRYHYRIDPDALTDEEWARYLEEWKYMQRLQSRIFKNNLRTVLGEAIEAVYGKGEI
ncbi:MAG: hypothetical protein K1X81_01875 [Bacteroidia bacterium]|nr:hypothetical protein [Bacteroidia bacterium]